MKIERTVYSAHLKKAKPVKYGNYKRVCMDLQIPADIGVYV